ncbi:tail fiber domain-containing protein [Puia sp. P3]|uniref:tail fiber domain-containing protein n=1 Tax=Puia sp. P3 TaxID=3423952 RepID=UPI003D66B495
MRVNELGNVGIGATAFNSSNPEQLLVNAGGTSSYNVISGKGTIDNYLQLNIQNQSNTFSASSDVVATAPNGSETADYIDMGINSGLFINGSQPIVGGVNTAYLYSTGNDFVIGNGVSGQNLIFFNGGFATTNEAFRITPTGVGVGTSSPADKLNVGGVLAPTLDNSYTMGKSTSRWSAVYAANGSIQTSDARLKTNIRPLDYGWHQLSAMHPVQYNWKDKPGGAAKIGLIAQKVRTLVPEVVSGDESRGHLGMNYSELIPVLIKTLKQQQRQLDLLKEQLAHLEDAK